MFFQMGVLKSFVDFAGKNLCRNLFNKVTGLKICNFIKMRHQHRCFSVKFAKFFKTPCFTGHCRSLLPVAASEAALRKEPHMDKGLEFTVLLFNRVDTKNILCLIKDVRQLSWMSHGVARV